MDDEVVLDPRLDAAQEGDPDEVLDVVARLASPEAAPEGLTIVSRFGDVVTGRLRREAIRRVHDDELVESLKLATPIRPERDDEPWEAESESDWPEDPELDPAGDADDPLPTETDDRRPTRDAATGRGSIIAIIDWWFDLAHPALRDAAGHSRVLAFFDQRDVTGVGQLRPAPYGYGRVLDRATIDRALAEPDPYTALNYRPWDGDAAGEGTHGTHVAGIAGGSAHVAPSGVAPGCEFLLVHLGGRESLGKSHNFLEGVDWIFRTAGRRPVVLSTSMGTHGDAHVGKSLPERALDQAVRAAPGRFLDQSTGNYFEARVHAAVSLNAGDERSVHWEVDPGDPTANELELWYPGADVVVLTVRSPDGREVRVAPGERGAIRGGDHDVCRAAHRRLDPNTGFNNAVCTLERDAPAGTWTVTLTGVDVVDGRCHLWIERDTRLGQSHFAAGDATTSTTTGSICNGLHTMAVGAYDAHTADRPIGRFSSVGPTVDGRRKPVLVAPGVRVLAAKSAAAGAAHGSPATTRKSGTSMAAPHVAGTVALMYEAAGRPLTAREIRHLPVQGADPPAADASSRERFGAGYLNIDRVLEHTRRWVRERPVARPEAEPEVVADADVMEPAAEGRPLLRDVGRLQSAPLAPAVAIAVAGRALDRALGRTWNRIGGLMGAVATEMGIQPAAVLAVWQVESGGRAYTAGRTVLRVENHLLFRAWGHAHPAEFDAYFQFGTRPPMTSAASACSSPSCDRPWRCHRSRQQASDPFTCDHTGQDREYEVLALATRLADEETALRCSSMGGPQILGSHYARLGYVSAVDVRDAFSADERWEVLAFFDFCRGGTGLIGALQGLRWADFAREYNGSGQVAAYAAKVEEAYTVARSLVVAPQATPAAERWVLAGEEGDERAEGALPELVPCAVDEGPPLEELVARVGVLHDPGRLYRTVVAGAEADGEGEALDEDYVVLARPGEQATALLEPGDVVLRIARGEPAASSVAVVASPQRWTAAQLRAEHGEGLLQPGEYVHAYLPPHNGGMGTIQPLRIQTAEGVLPSDSVVLRPRHPGGRAEAPAEGGADDQGLGIPEPTTLWGLARRADQRSSLLGRAALDAAAAENATKHPGQSGIAPAAIRARLGRYVDLGAVRAALTAAGVDPTVRNGDVDHALCEAAHQFQLHTVARAATGLVGPSTLDDLGLTAHRLHTAPAPTGVAARVLAHRSAELTRVMGGGDPAGGWAQDILEGTFLGRAVRGGVHRILMRRLRAAERALVAQPLFAGMTPVALGAALGIGTADTSSGRRPSATAANMHVHGLAIDIAPFANPWVGGQTGTEAEASAAFSLGLANAALVISGERIPASASELFARLGSDAELCTADIHAVLRARDSDLRAYLRLAGDDAAVRARVVDAAGAPQPGVVGSGESADAAAARWSATIAADAAALRSPGSNFSPGRNPRDGFLNLPVELVVALRESGCLAWGAVDFGPRASGDMMHFDCRAQGAGRVLAAATPFSPGGWLPSPAVHSNHPCAAARARSGFEAAVEAETDGGDPFAAAARCPIDAHRYDPTGDACATGPAPGTSALRQLLRDQFGARRAGIFNCRNVHGGSTLSLHAEGRAVDYYLDATDPAELAIGNSLVQWLLESDAVGNAHARARRLGVQEVIWNHQIWSAGRRRDEGLRPYTGQEPHLDHVHVGQHRLGAAMRTTFWAGC